MAVFPYSAESHPYSYGTTSLCVLPNGDFLVADQRGNCVHRFNKKLEEWDLWGDRIVTNSGCLMAPSDVVYKPHQDQVLVTVPCYGRIYVCDRQGHEAKRTLWTYPGNPPRRIALGPLNRLFAVLTNCCDVHIASDGQTFNEQIRTKDYGFSQSTRVLDVAANPNSIYVALLLEMPVETDAKVLLENCSYSYWLLILNVNILENQVSCHRLPFPATRVACHSDMRKFAVLTSTEGPIRRFPEKTLAPEKAYQRIDLYDAHKGFVGCVPCSSRVGKEVQRVTDLAFITETKLAVVGQNLRSQALCVLNMDY